MSKLSGNLLKQMQGLEKQLSPHYQLNNRLQGGKKALSNADRSVKQMESAMKKIIELEENLSANLPSPGSSHKKKKRRGPGHGE